MTVSINSIELVGFMPRINTIFDEMSHQAFFLMPALLYTAVNGNYKIAIPVFIAFIVTISASFLAALPIALIILGFIFIGVVLFLPKGLISIFEYIHYFHGIFG
jgi:hypothetical protein